MRTSFAMQISNAHRCNPLNLPHRSIIAHSSCLNSIEKRWRMKMNFQIEFYFALTWYKQRYYRSFSSICKNSICHSLSKIKRTQWWLVQFFYIEQLLSFKSCTRKSLIGKLCSVDYAHVVYNRQLTKSYEFNILMLMSFQHEISN